MARRRTPHESKRPAARRRAYAAVAALALGSIAIAIAVTRGSTSRPTKRAVADASVAIADARSPIVEPARTYVGSAACQRCHADEYTAWQTSWHARALAPATGASVVGAFNAAHFKGTSSEAWMTKRGDRDVMRTTNADGSLADFPVDYVIGGKRMQDALTVFPDGRWQVLPIYWHQTGHEWVDYTEAKQGALTPSHPFYWTNVRRMANHECLDCHTTGLHVAYTDNHWTTDYVDGSVSCEACHGPGSLHAATKKPDDIVHPVDAKRVGPTSCYRCHGPRKPLWPLLDAEHQFQPARDGEALDELYEPIVVTLPDGTSPDFFVDGKPRTSSFEYQAMLQSACFRKGGATCVTCHTAPHEAKRPSELRVDANATCASCHAPIVAAGKAHTHHAKATCVDCHMPKIVAGVLDQFADHALDVPVPNNHGVPDACATCHRDKPVDVATYWPDAAGRQARRRRLADAFDPATAQQSGRPLVAVIDDRDEAPTLRAAAMIIAARRFGPPTAPKMAAYLDDPSVILRAKACEALGAARAVNAADRVAAHLGDRSIRVRQACALALSDMRDPRGEAALQQLADDPETSRLAIPHRDLGVAKLRRHDFAGARHELEQAAALLPYSVDTLVELAGADADLGDFAAARTRLAQALALEPHDAHALALRDKLPSSP